MDTLFLLFTVLQDFAPTFNFSDFNNFLSCSKPCSIPPVLRPFLSSWHPCTPKLSPWPVGLSAKTFTVSPSNPQVKSNLSFHTTTLDSPTLFKQKEWITMKLKIVVATRKLQVSNVWFPVTPCCSALKRWQSQHLSQFLPVAPWLFPGLQVMAPRSAPFDAAHMNYW